MCRFLVAFAAAFLTLAPASRGTAADEFEDWNLEPGVAQAHLVLVARVTSVGQLTVVEGAKTDVALREYRFQPIRRLKGIFQRDQLSMTAADLGCPASEAAAGPCVKEGEFRLLILAQQQGRFMGCVSAAPGATTFAERVPLLSGPDDPLVGVVDTLIRVADARSRRARAGLLLERLDGARGVAAVPLLSSLRLRADWAATDDRTLPALTRLTRDPAPAVRVAAVEVLRDVVAQRVPPTVPGRMDDAAGALRGVLEAAGAGTRERLAAIEGLGHVNALRPGLGWPGTLLIVQLKNAETNAERAVAAAALAQAGDAQVAAAVMDALARLPLDEPPAREAVYARAAVRLDAPAAERVLRARLERSLRARQSLLAEVEALGRLQSKESVTLLLEAAGRPAVDPADRQRIAWALGKAGDDRAVPVLVGSLRGEDYQLKEVALTALESLDSPAAAREARPLLKSEAHLPYKLRLARLLARHELADGYALATEHLADAGTTPAAALVLVALGDARAAKDLGSILAARPDRRWHGAALAGLAALGDAGARKQLLDILGDDRNPLAADAAEAAGFAGDAALVGPLTRLAQSRDRQLEVAALVALRRFFTDVRTAPRGLAAAEAEEGDRLQPTADVPPATRALVTTAVAALALDPHVDAGVRMEAFTVARLLRGEGYDKLLAELTDQAELEGTPLLAAAEAERRRLRGVVN